MFKKASVLVCGIFGIILAENSYFDFSYKMRITGYSVLGNSYIKLYKHNQAGEFYYDRCSYGPTDKFQCVKYFVQCNQAQYVGVKLTNYSSVSGKFIEEFNVTNSTYAISPNDKFCYWCDSIKQVGGF